MADKIRVTAKGDPSALVTEMVKRIKWPWGEINGQLTRKDTTQFVPAEEIKGGFPEG